MTRTLKTSFVIAIVSVAALAGCALRTPRIADIQYDRSRYLDRTVSVQGTVVSSWNVPFMPFGLYKVDDGTGELTVVSRGDRTPRAGARVRVRGKVQDVASLGNQSVGLHLEERNVDVLRYR